MNPGWRILDCSGLEGSLRYTRGQLVIHRDGEADVALPLAQLAVVLIGIKTSISGAVLLKLSEYDVAVLVCDWKNVPVAGAYPWAEHTRIGARQQAQASLSLPRRKKAWARIINAKIHGQAQTLSALGLPGSRQLLDLSKKIRSGDPDNYEAQAAKAYWNYLSAQSAFSRLPGAGHSGWNAALDYGYTLLRGHGIRAITSAGLSGTLGVFHHGRGNSFALVDDLMEPFRPLIDQVVASSIGLDEELTPAGKKQISESLTLPFDSEGKSCPSVFIDFAQQFGLYVEGNIENLSVPRWKGALHGDAGE